MLPWKALAKVLRQRWLAEVEWGHRSFSCQHAIITRLLRELGRTKYSDVWKEYYPDERVAIFELEHPLISMLPKKPAGEGE